MTDGTMATRASGDGLPLDRAAVAEQRFKLPVVLAALASVPAMFLTMLEGTAAVVGAAVNYATLAVFLAESVVLFALAGNRLRWLRQHKTMVLIAAVSIPAVLFAAGPVQVLRVVRFVGALRILRVRRVMKAGRILRDRAGLEGWAWNAAAIGLTAASAAFVGVVLTDPTSDSRRLLDQVVGRFGWIAVLMAGLLLGGATLVLRTTRDRANADE